MTIDDLELTDQDIAWCEADAIAEGDAGRFRVTQCVRARSGCRSAINAIKYTVYDCFMKPASSLGELHERARNWRARHQETA